MSFQRPTLSELITRTKQDFESRLKTAGSLLRRAVATVFARVVAGAAHLMHGHLEFIGEQVFPDSAAEKYFRRHASIWGVPQNPASYASGNINMIGTNGKVITTGARLRRSDGWEYLSTADVTIVDEAASVPLLAVTEGVDGNCEAGIELTLVEPIAGVNSTGIVDSDEISGGADVEDIELWRGRVLDRIRKPPMGGADEDYKKWAREVPGVTRVWEYPLWLGPGTVGVCFVRDGDGTGMDIIPDEGEVAAVQAYINVRRPVTANVTVFTPIADEIDYTIAVIPNTAAVKAAVAAELADMHFRDGQTGGTIPLTHMNEAISLAEGETDHTLISPTESYEADPGHLPILGTITWVEA